MAGNEELIIKIKAETDKAIKEIDKLNKEVSKLSKSKSGKWTSDTASGFDSVAKSAASLKTKLAGLAATFLSIQGAKALISTTAEIEDGFIGIAKTTGLTGQAFDDLKAQLLTLGESMAGIKTSELQDIAETAGQLGIQGSEDIIKFTEVIAKIGATTELSANEAATAMAKLGNSMKVPVSDFEKLGSVINELSNTTTATAGDLLNMGQRISGVGKTFGLTADEVLGLSASLTDVGMSAELGGTAISNVMMKMLQDTDAFAKAAGVSFEEFSQMIKDKPVQALELFLESIGKMDKAAQISTLKDLGLSASGTAQAVLKLSGNTDVLAKNLNTAATEWQKNTSLQNEYKTSSEGFNAQLTQLGNMFTSLESKIGDALLPKLKELVDEFKTWMESLTKDEISQFADQIATVITAIGSMSLEIGKVIGNIVLWGSNNATLVKSLALLYVSIKGLQVASGLMGMSFAASGAKAVAMGGALTSLNAGAGALLGGLRAVVSFAGPWGVALAAMGTAAVAAMNSYEESARKAIEANNAVAESLNTRSSSMDQISNDMQKANQEMAEHGSVALATRDQIRQAMQDELAAAQAQAAAWQQSGQASSEAMVQLGNQIGLLKAELDIFDVVYPLKIEVEDGDIDKKIEEAQKNIDDLTKKEHKVKVEADTKDLKKKLDAAIKDVEGKSITAKVDADTHTADAKIQKTKKEAEKPVKTEVNFNPDTHAADRARANIAKPIRVPVTYVPTNSPTTSHKDGGLVPQKLASGGTFKGSGRVPGYDPLDRDLVNAKLTGGEFVIRREAVKRFGTGLLYSINNMTAKLPGYASGGEVGGGSVSQDMQPINLNIGGKTFQTMADAEVANALQRFIETEGGL